MAILNYTTTVDAFKTVSEIEYILMKHGAKSIMKNYEDQSVTGLSFLIDTGKDQIPVRMPVKIDECMQVLKKEKAAGQKNIKDTREQAERSIKMDKGKDRSDRRKALVIKMYQDGKDKPEIAAESGYQIPTINRILSSAGIIQKRYIRDCADEIVRMYRDGKSAGEIAEKTGFSAANIRIWMAENGLYHPIRRKTEETEPVYREMAQDKRKIRRMVIRGKPYIDITDYYAGI